MRKLTVMALLATFAGASVSAAAAAPQPDAASAEEPAKKDKVKCKRVDESSSGSNLKKWTKVCKPASNWNPDRVAFERSLEKMRDQGLVNPAPLQASGTSPR
jgi:hypothetical protein